MRARGAPKSRTEPRNLFSRYVTRFVDYDYKPPWATCRSLNATLHQSLTTPARRRGSLRRFAAFWAYAAQFPPHAHAGLHDYIGGAVHEQALSPFRRVVDKHFHGLVPPVAW